MKRLFNLSKDGITLGQLRDFLNITCESLPSDTVIRVNDSDDSSYDCRLVLADEQNITLYCN